MGWDKLHFLLLKFLQKSWSYFEMGVNFRFREKCGKKGKCEKKEIKRNQNSLKFFKGKRSSPPFKKSLIKVMLYFLMPNNFRFAEKMKINDNVRERMIKRKKKRK